jgi:glycosyltransferase involved in cell wall biosynthesis
VEQCQRRVHRMNSQRIVFLVPDLNNPNYKGGIQVFNTYVYRALRDIGHDVTIIAVNDRPEDAAPNVIPCNRGPRARKVLGAANLAKQVLLRRPDVVLCGHLNFAPLCRRICGVRGVPFITITHGIELWDADPKKIQAAAASHRILAVSRYTKSLNIELLPKYNAEHIIVFSNTFDEQRFRPQPVPEDFWGRVGLSPNDRFVLTVGRLATTERLKGYDEAIQAMAVVRQAIPDAKYVLAGRGNDMDRLRSVADACGLGEGLVLPGFIAEDDIVPLFNACELFVLPSRKEGFGIVFLEAMGCGKPVIGGNRDGSMDPLCDGSLGTAIDPEDVDALQTAIVEHLQGRAPASRSDSTHLRSEAIARFGFDAFRDRVRGVLGTL